MAKKNAITLEDVARHAGISYQTVSRVINNAPHVSDKTRKKVEDAMKALSYVPNRIAQQLAGRSHITIGVAIAELGSHAPAMVANAIKQQAFQHDVSVVIAVLQPPYDLQSCKEAVNELLSFRVDGLVINVALNDDDALQVQEMCTRIPAIFLDVNPALDVANIRFDTLQSTRVSVQHLVALGHEKIALLNGPFTSISARLRYEGWLAALAEFGLEPFAVKTGDWSAHSGYEMANQLLAMPAHPTAILVANDQISLGVLRAIQEYGLEIPQQISVIGYDDTEDSPYFYPPLTTVKQDFDRLGKESVDHLLKMIEGDNDATRVTKILLPASLVERKTTAKVNNAKVTPASLAKQLRQVIQQLNELQANDK